MYKRFKIQIQEHIKKNKESIIKKINEIDKMLLKDDKKVLKMNIYSINISCKKKGDLLNEFKSYVNENMK